MGNGQHSTVVKLGTDGSLDEVISFQVNGSCGFIQNQDPALAEQGSGQAYQLPLAHAEEGEAKICGRAAVTCLQATLPMLFLELFFLTSPISSTAQPFWNTEQKSGHYKVRGGLRGRASTQGKSQPPLTLLSYPFPSLIRARKFVLFCQSIIL